MACPSAVFLDHSAPRADPFGIPAAFFYLLLRQRAVINPPIDKSLVESRGKQFVVVSKSDGNINIAASLQRRLN